MEAPPLTGSAAGSAETPGDQAKAPHRPLAGGGAMGLLALLGGQWLALFLLHERLTERLGLRLETSALRVLPGLVWPLGLAWLAAAWQARRRRRSTALPLGFHFGSALWVTAAVLAPAYKQAIAHRTDADGATLAAWSAGVAMTALVGVGQLLLAPLATRLLRSWSRELALSLGGFLALSSVALMLPFFTQYSLLAVVGLLALFTFVPLGLPRPFGWSAAWLALGAGLTVQLMDHTIFELPQSVGSLLPNWEWDQVSSGLGSLWLQPEFLLAAVPLLVGTLVRDLVLLKEASSTDPSLQPTSSLAALGLLNLGGSLVGCGFPLGVLPGFPALRRIAAGQGYSQAAGLLTVLAALLGWLPVLISWAPLPTLGVLLAGTLLLSAGQSFNSLASGSGYLLAAAALPFFLETDSVHAPSALLIALVWGGLAACMKHRNWAAAVWICLTAAVLASAGVLHHARWSWDFDPVAGAYLTLAAVFHLAYVYGTALAPPRAAASPSLDQESSSRAADSSASSDTDA